MLCCEHHSSVILSKRSSCLLWKLNMGTLLEQSWISTLSSLADWPSLLIAFTMYSACVEHHLRMCSDSSGCNFRPLYKDVHSAEGAWVCWHHAFMILSSREASLILNVWAVPSPPQTHGMILSLAGLLQCFICAVLQKTTTCSKCKDLEKYIFVELPLGGPPAEEIQSSSLGLVTR